MKTFRQFIRESTSILQESTLVGIYPHGQGSDVHPSGGSGNGEVSNHNIQKTVGNEPFKDKEYFRRPSVKRRMRYLGQGVRNSSGNVPPVLGTSHPADPKAKAIVDGNHRLEASKRNPRQNTIPVQNVHHDNTHLMPDYSKIDHSGDTSEKIKNHGVPLSTFREPHDGSYDMQKKRKELGGLTLGHYFVNPDGTHNFKDPRK